MKTIEERPSTVTAAQMIVGGESIVRYSQFFRIFTFRTISYHVAVKNYFQYSELLFELTYKQMIFMYQLHKCHFKCRNLYTFLLCFVKPIIIYIEIIEKVLKNNIN